MTDTQLIAAYLARNGATLIPEGASAATDALPFDAWQTEVDAVCQDFARYADTPELA